VAVQRLSNSGRNGYSYKSLIAGITPVPSVPTIGTATELTFASATVEFTAPGDYAGTTYTATSSPGGFTGTSATSPIVVAGLSGETTYTFTVTATNATGTSRASAASNSITTPAEFIPSSSFDALATYTVPSGGVSSITFAGIPTGGQYSHLQIRCLAKGSGDAGEDRYSAQMRFNGDTSANYASHYLTGNGTSASAGAFSSTTAIDMAGRSWIPDSWSGYANMWGVAIMDILDYASTTKAKTLRTLAGYNSNTTGTTGNNINLTSGLWFKTPEAINSITIICDQSGLFIQGSQFSLYGVK
jgi:hypothetical protein